MKNTQNDKKMQIHSRILVVGIDIGKDTHYARAFDFRGIEVGRLLKFKSKRKRKRKHEHTFHLLCIDEKMDSSSTWRSWFLWPEKQSKSYGRGVSKRSNLAA